MSRHSPYIVILLTILFLTLGVSATFCQALHSALDHNTHHQADPRQLGLCYWSCHFNNISYVTLHTTPPIDILLLAFDRVFAGFDPVFPFISRLQVPARAPPLT